MLVTLVAFTPSACALSSDARITPTCCERISAVANTRSQRCALSMREGELGFAGPRIPAQALQSGSTGRSREATCPGISGHGAVHWMVPCSAGRWRNRQITVVRQLPPDKTGMADSETSSEARDDAKTDPNDVSIAAWFMLALLLMTNIHQQWTRALVFYIVSFKVPPSDENARLYMNIDLGFGEEQYGLLASFGFTLVFTICSLVAGRAADSGNRAGITAAAAAGWSVATAGQGLANSFDTVLGARALTGMTQAFTNPAAYGLIASTFPESRVSTANSIYSSAVYVGGALASLTILLDNQIGWRDSSIAIGVRQIVVDRIAFRHRGQVVDRVDVVVGSVGPKHFINGLVLRTSNFERG